MLSIPRHAQHALRAVRAAVSASGVGQAKARTNAIVGTSAFWGAARSFTTITCSIHGLGRLAAATPTTVAQRLISGSPATHGSSAVDRRGFAAAATGGEPPLSPDEVRKRMDAINDSFAEAREEIECAMEAVGTTFFNEEAEYAQEVTGKVLDMYYALCDAMPAEEKAATQRAMGMKMEQLKAELKLLDHAHDDD
mmetsp:Transcript_24490/g.39396  ORF Transcript_24490/g.39396 Transcript_24490/m.39396 type:complete len:195 (+) Transcript_24490:249-833(+)